MPGNKDRISPDRRSARESQVIEDDRNAGRSFESRDPDRGDPYVLSPHNTGGPIEQTINAEAVAHFGKPGAEADISGGLPNLGAETNAPVKENKYNR